MELYTGSDTDTLFKIRGRNPVFYKSTTYLFWMHHSFIFLALSFFFWAFSLPMRFPSLRKVIFPSLYKAVYEQLIYDAGWSHGHQFNWKGEQLSDFDEDQKNELLHQAGWDASKPEKCHKIAIEFLHQIEVFAGSKMVTEKSKDFPSGQTFSGPTTQKEGDDAFIVVLWVQNKKDDKGWYRDCYKFGLDGTFAGYFHCPLVWGRPV